MVRRPLAVVLLAVVVAPVFALTACGEDREASRIAPPKTVPARGFTPPRGGAEGYALAQYRDLVLSSRRVHGGYRLMARQGSGDAHAVGVPDEQEPFVVALGADAAGRTVAVYPRADRLVALDPATGVERTVLRTATVARAVAVDRGAITYALVDGHRSTIRVAALDGSSKPYILVRVPHVVTALAASHYGVAYVAFIQTEPTGAHSQNHLTLHGRVIAVTGYGEEGGADITSVAFSGPDLYWSISGSDDGPTYGSVERLNLRTGRRRSLSTPGGGVFSAAPDGADPNAPTAVAYEPVAGQDYEPDPRHQVVRRFPPAAFGPARP